MQEKLTREDIEKIFDETLEDVLKVPPEDRPLPKLPPEVERALGELKKLFSDGETEQDEKNWVQPSLTSAEIELSQLTDLKEGERRDEWFADPPEKCDFCRVELVKRRYMADGKLKGSVGWANMCAECFFANGEGIGWGRGQAYLQWRLGEWLMVGGFPSDETD